MSFGEGGLVAEVGGAREADDLVSRGWEPPTRRRWGRPFSNPNYSRAVSPQAVGPASAMAVSVLRDLWGVPGPDSLLAEKVNDAGGPSVDALGVPTQP